MHRLEDAGEGDGGLAPARLREMERLSDQLRQSGDLDLTRERALKAGTRLVRDWHGKVYTVTMVDQGYLFEGRQNSSLTPIAREITGAAWSGARFFGLKSDKVANGTPQD